jgi:hypothetical protein
MFPSGKLEDSEPEALTFAAVTIAAMSVILNLLLMVPAMKGAFSSTGLTTSVQALQVFFFSCLLAHRREPMLQGKIVPVN